MQFQSHPPRPPPTVFLGETTSANYSKPIEKSTDRRLIPVLTQVIHLPYFARNKVESPRQQKYRRGPFILVAIVVTNQSSTTAREPLKFGQQS